MKKAFLLLSLALLAEYAGWGQPTFHDTYADRFVSAGYQYYSHELIGDFHTITINTEVLYSFVGSRASLAFGEDYFMFSPAGLLLFIPNIFLGSVNDLAGNPAATMLMALGISALQFHIPLTDHLEISTGWDALKFVKFKSWEDKYFVVGSLNLGLNAYLGNHIYINAGYEFNHSHNPLLKAINWLYKPPRAEGIPLQPEGLMGHSFFAKLGVMF